MAVAIYNAKGNIPIRNFTWSRAKWNLGSNKIMKFPDEVGEALLKTYPFLERVTLENIQDIKKRMVENKFKCDVCGYETTARIALLQHKKKHVTLEEDKQFIDTFDEAKPEGDYTPPPQNKPITPEGIEKGLGISEKSGFYGKGLETDTLTDMKVNIPGKTKGIFGG